MPPVEPGKPTRYLTLLRRAHAGEVRAREAFAEWVYTVMRRVLRAYGRRWSADEMNDAVQHAVWHVIERAAHCRAANDYQLRAWVALVGWRAVLRERVEHQSLDARPGAVRRDAGAAGFRDTNAWPPDPPGPTAAQLTALVQALSAAFEGPADATRMAAGRALDPAATIAREHAAFARALLCRLAVEGYGTLPADTQRIFWTRLVEGATWAAVAADAGTTEAAAKRRLQRASRTLGYHVAVRVRELSPGHAALIAAHCRRLGIALPSLTHRRSPAPPDL